jgi:hypothetical protein
VQGRRRGGGRRKVRRQERREKETKEGSIMIPDARVACTAMNPEDLPISFTIPMGMDK